jgi:tetratricopeptide (TPR) repeat protein
MIARIWFSFWLGIIILNSLPGSATSFEQAKTDSLRWMLSRAEDSAKLRLYKDLYDFWYRYDVDSARKAVIDGYDFARKLNDDFSMADFLFRFGRLHSYSGAYDSSIYYYRKAIDVSATAKYEQGELNAAVALIGEYSNIGLPGKGIEMGNSYEQQIERFHDTRLLISFFLATGVCYGSLGEYDRAEGLFDEALLLSRNNNMMMTVILNNKAAIYSYKGDYQSTTKALKESLVFVDTTDAWLLVDIYINLGTAMSDLYGDGDSARYYFMKGMTASKAHGYVPGEAFINKHIGISYYNEGDFDRALPYLEQAAQQFPLSKQPKELMSVLEKLEKVHHTKGHQEKAYDYLNQYIEISESLSLTEQKEEIKKLDFQNRVEQIENEKELLDRDIRHLNQRSVEQLIIIGSLLVLVVILVIFQVKVNQKKKLLFLKLQELLEKSNRTKSIPQFSFPENNGATDADPGDEAFVVSNKPRISEETISVISQRLKKWVYENGFLERTTMNEVASKLHTNSKYLSEVITQDFFHNNFNEFINKLRIDYILVKMKQDPDFLGYTVESLADHLGYGSRTTFIKAFKEVTGLTPNYYLQQLRKERVGEGISKE